MEKYKIKDIEELNGELILQLINRFKIKEVPRLNRLKNYYLGESNILKRIRLNLKICILYVEFFILFEADMIRERQIEGIAEAKTRGVYKGRPHTYTEKHSGLQHAIELYNNRANNKYTVKRIAEITKISKATIYRAIRERKEY